MQAARIPENETERLKTLHEYALLDTMPERVFDDLTKIAAEICDTSISLVSLVDRDRQWFKSKVGLEVNETSRDIAFCSHAILEEEVFVVEDTALDERFVDNPLVTDNPDIRFYAGAPIKAKNGMALGTLCVIDQKPMTLSKSKEDALAALARQVEVAIELKRQNKELEAALEEIETLRGIIPICSYCHKMRDDEGLWEQLELYLSKNTEAQFSHGICPECVPKVRAKMNLSQD